MRPSSPRVAWTAYRRRRPGGAPGAADRMLEAACIGALVGGGIQFLVQLPGLRGDLAGFRVSFDLSSKPMREVLAGFGPTLAGRGVVQLSSYLDQLLASLLAAGAVAALFYAQTLYLLPVSLFGMSVAAAALPRLARSGGAGSEAELSAGTERALETAAFLNLPSFLAYLLLGLPLVEGIFQLFGKGFGAAESRLVYLVLAAYAVGLPASTSARVLQAGFYARGDSRTPARIAVLRVAVSLVVGLPAMLWLDRQRLGDLEFLGSPGSALRLGAVGLGAGGDSGRLDRARGAAPGGANPAAESRLAGARLPAFHPLRPRRRPSGRARCPRDGGWRYPSDRARGGDLHDLRRRLPGTRQRSGRGAGQSLALTPAPGEEMIRSAAGSPLGGLRSPRSAMDAADSGQRCSWPAGSPPPAARRSAWESASSISCRIRSDPAASTPTRSSCRSSRPRR